MSGKKKLWVALPLRTVSGSGAHRMWSGGQPLLAISVLGTGAVPTQSVDHNLQLRTVPPQLLHPGSVFV